VSAYVALALLTLIGIFTNLFFFQRFSTALVTPEGHTLGPWVISGGRSPAPSSSGSWHATARSASAATAFLKRLKPFSSTAAGLNQKWRCAQARCRRQNLDRIRADRSAPRGPIIMTGGAVGSLFAQFCHLTSGRAQDAARRRRIGGMSATFAAPLAAVLLAVELLLFEWKPRSVIPVALASATAAAMRRYLIGLGPLFPCAAAPGVSSDRRVCSAACWPVCCRPCSRRQCTPPKTPSAPADPLDVVAGDWRAGDRHRRLAFPQALGLSATDVIGSLLQGEVAGRVILGVLIVKSVIWSVSLGSGTSGGVLAPLLMMGGALGGG